MKTQISVAEQIPCFRISTKKAVSRRCVSGCRLASGHHGAGELNLDDLFAGDIGGDGDGLAGQGLNEDLHGGFN